MVRCWYCDSVIINRKQGIRYCNYLCKSRYHSKFNKKKKKIKNNPVIKLKKNCSAEGCKMTAIGIFEKMLLCRQHMRMKKIILTFIKNQENKEKRHRLTNHRCPECWKKLTRPHQWFCGNKCRDKYSLYVFAHENKLNVQEVEHLLMN